MPVAVVGEPAAKWTLDHIGIGPDPADYVDGVARPPGERQVPLPFGLVYENPRTFEPLSDAETTRLRRPVCCARRLFQNTSLLVAKIRAGETEENWERDLPTFGKPDGLDRVFFSCAACHVGRVMDVRRDEVPAGDAEYRDRSAGTTRSC